MPVKQGTFGTSPIYNGLYKIGKIFRGVDLVYQSVVYNPVIALIERNIEKVDIELTSEITKIGSYAFNSCESLKSIKIPNSVTSIGVYAFNGCTSLTKITIPNSVTSIGMASFANCESLNEMTVLATTPPGLGASAISEATTIIYIPSGTKSSYESATSWKDLLTRTTNPITFVEV